MPETCNWSIIIIVCKATMNVIVVVIIDIIIIIMIIIVTITMGITIIMIKSLLSPGAVEVVGPWLSFSSPKQSLSPASGSSL